MRSELLFGPIIPPTGPVGSELVGAIVGAGVGVVMGDIVGLMVTGLIGDWVRMVIGDIVTGLIGAGVGAIVGDVVGFVVTGLIGLSGSPRFAGKLQCCQPSDDLRHWAFPQHCDVGWQVTHIAKHPTCSLG